MRLTENSAFVPWQTAQLSPIEVVMATTCEASAVLVWHPMHAAATGPIGFTLPRGLTTGMRPSLSGNYSEPATHSASQVRDLLNLSDRCGLSSAILIACTQLGLHAMEATTKERRWFWATLTLSSITIVTAVFALWELVENRFFRNFDYVTLHHLYITRGIASSLLLTFWAAWYVLRQRRHSE